MNNRTLLVFLVMPSAAQVLLKKRARASGFCVIVTSSPTTFIALFLCSNASSQARAQKGMLHFFSTQFPFRTNVKY